MSNGPRASRPLFGCLGASDRNGEGPFVFTFQRASRLAEAGAHHWFRKLRSKATKGEWDLLGDVTFHDLRPDSAHRAREAGWTIEEVAYYLGHVTKKGAQRLQGPPRDTLRFPERTSRRSSRTRAVVAYHSDGV